MPKNVKWGTLWVFSTSNLLQNIKKVEGGPSGDKKFLRKSLRQALRLTKPKNERGDTLVSSDFVCYVIKGTKTSG